MVEPHSEWKKSLSTQNKQKKKFSRFSRADSLDEQHNNKWDFLDTFQDSLAIVNDTAFYRNCCRYASSRCLVWGRLNNTFRQWSRFRFSVILAWTFGSCYSCCCYWCYCSSFRCCQKSTSCMTSCCSWVHTIHWFLRQSPARMCRKPRNSSYLW